MKILIAEDDFTSRTILAGVLKNSGHEVVETIDGNEAWLALQMPDAPKLVILDWMMPEMDGPEVLRRVRALQTDRPPYIIMLTAKGEKNSIIAGLGAGANDYLAKPFDPGELLIRVEVGERMVEMQLRQHRQRANAQRIRVENAQRMAEMQDALAAKASELGRAQADLHDLATRLQAMHEDELATLSRDLQDSIDPHLTTLHKDLLWMDSYLQATLAPDHALLCDKTVAMLRMVKRMSDLTQTLAALRPGV